MDPMHLLAVLAGHPYPITFALLVLTGLGMPVPEDVILVAAGAVVSWGGSGFYPLVGVALLGILVGDGLVFSLGHRYGTALLHRRPFRYLVRPHRLAKARHLFRKRGAGAIWLARFVPGVRFVVFFLAGASGVGTATFFAMDLLGALISVPLLVLVGYSFGANLGEALAFLSAHRWQAVAVVLATVAGAWLVSRVGRALGLWRAIGKVATGAGLALRAYLGRHRAARIALLGCLALTVGWYAVRAARPLPAQDRNHQELARIPAIQPGETFSFAVLGDNRNSQRVFDEILRRIDDDPEIRFAIDLGDLVFDAEKEKYRFFLEQLTRAKKPFLVAPGNHDIREKGRTAYYEAFGPFYYAFRVGDATFVVLDDANEMGFEPSQWAWAEKTLTAAQDAPYRFVLFHVPLFDPRHRSNLEWAEPILPGPTRRWLFRHSLQDPATADRYAKTFARLKVTRIYASHIHGHYEGRWSGVPFTVTGGAGAPLVGMDPDHDFYHYVKVTVGPDGVRQEVVPIPSPPFGLFARVGTLALLHLDSFVVTHGVGIIVAGLVGLLLWDLVEARRREGKEP